VFGGLAMSERSTDRQTRPDFVLILVDDMGFSDLGCTSTWMTTSRIIGAVLGVERM